MTLPIPKVDTRSAEDIVEWVKQQEGFKDLHNDQLSEALVHIFARYCEIIIERLNQAPEKNYRAFLNLLSVSRNPPIAAQVPVTFIPVKNFVTQIIVPQYTKVAAAPTDGGSSPIVFETNQALTVTQAELVKIVALDTQADCYSNVSCLTSLGHEIVGVSPFKGVQQTKHELNIGVEDAIAKNHTSRLELTFTIAKQQSAFLDYRLEWRIKSENGEQLIIPDSDTTGELKHSGVIIFDNLPMWKTSRKGGREGYWLSCRLLYSNKSTEIKQQHAIKLEWSTINKIEVTGYANLAETRLDNASCNNLQIDLDKDFLPLGEKPHFGDVFYLNSQGFKNLEADVTLNIKLTNPASGETESPIPRANRTGRAIIQWEFWNGSYWDVLNCSDDTQALTEDGKVSFVMPGISKEKEANGLRGYWVRARLIAGHYGLQERVEYISQQSQGQNIKYIPSTLAPPAIATITVSATKKTGPSEPPAVVTDNDFIISHIDIFKTKALVPFKINLEPIKALHFVFKAADKTMLANQGLDFYFKIDHMVKRIVYSGDQQFPTLSWQYWNGEGWEMCKIRHDGTQSFNATGVVSLFIPDDIACWEETESSMVEGASPEVQSDVNAAPTKISSSKKKSLIFGIRVVWVTGNYLCEPVIQRVLLNTVLAKQVLTLENEILGSSNGTLNQIFYSARTPILGKLMLEVKEPQRSLMIESSRKSAKDVTEGEWVSWHEVSDFLESSPSDRHFVIERFSGELRFGNGIKGMLPPAGANNIRLHIYKTGGGSSGNKPANSVTQLRTSLRGIAAVTNYEPAIGGMDEEDWSSVYARGSAYLRHRRRAITAADYEDLARIASPLIAKAKCFPLRDLSSDFQGVTKPGVVSLVIVPKDRTSEPRPSLDLLRNVWEFINPLRMQSTYLVLGGPEYLYINVEAEIVPRYESMDMDIATACRERLEAFLHPLTGGENADGWVFGKWPHSSDVYALLESVPGLEFVRSLQVNYQEERAGLLESRDFLVCSGKHKITLSL